MVSNGLYPKPGVLRERPVISAVQENGSHGVVRRTDRQVFSLQKGVLPASADVHAVERRIIVCRHCPLLRDGIPITKLPRLRQGPERVQHVRRELRFEVLRRTTFQFLLLRFLRVAGPAHQDDVVAGSALGNRRVVVDVPLAH